MTTIDQSLATIKYFVNVRQVDFKITKTFKKIIQLRLYTFANNELHTTTLLKNETLPTPNRRHPSIQDLVHNLEST